MLCCDKADFAGHCREAAESNTSEKVASPGNTPKARHVYSTCFLRHKSRLGKAWHQEQNISFLTIRRRRAEVLGVVHGVRVTFAVTPGVPVPASLGVALLSAGLCSQTRTFVLPLPHKLGVHWQLEQSLPIPHKVASPTLLDGTVGRRALLVAILSRKRIDFHCEDLEEVGRLGFCLSSS